MVRSKSPQEYVQCVVEACALIGGPEVRSVATIGGSAAHALPASDGTISSLAQDKDSSLGRLALRLAKRACQLRQSNNL